MKAELVLLMIAAVLTNPIQANISPLDR